MEYRLKIILFKNISHPMKVLLKTKIDFYEVLSVNLFNHNVKFSMVQFLIYLHYKIVYLFWVRCIFIWKYIIMNIDIFDNEW